MANQNFGTPCHSFPTPDTTREVPNAGAMFGRNCHIIAEDNSVKMARLVFEALESAFLLANIFLNNYGSAKIFDIVNQILPTAYVYNTGYWVFYKNSAGVCPCVCTKFGLICPHIKGDGHYVNMRTVVENQPIYFSTTRHNGKLFPIKAYVEVTPIITDILRAYDIKIGVTVLPLTVRQENFALNGKGKVSITIQARYVLVPEYFPLRTNIVRFQPHPLATEMFSSYFQNLNQFQDFLSTYGSERQVPLSHTIVSLYSPIITVTPGYGCSRVCRRRTPYQTQPSAFVRLHFQQNVTMFVSSYEQQQYQYQQRSNSESFKIVVNGRRVRHAIESTRIFLSRNFVPSIVSTAHEETTVSNSTVSSTSSSSLTTNPSASASHSPVTDANPTTPTTSLVNPLLEYLQLRSNTENISSQSSLNEEVETARRCSVFQGDQEEQLPEPNFLGLDYETAFPALPVPKHFEKNLAMGFQGNEEPSDESFQLVNQVCEEIIAGNEEEAVGTQDVNNNNNRNEHVMEIENRENEESFPPRSPFNEFPTFNPELGIQQRDHHYPFPL